MAKKNKKAELCPKCSRYKRPDVVSDSLLSAGVPWLQSTREVDEFPNRTRETAYRHVIASDEILAQYDFRGNDWRAACSFPGRHTHAMGYIVKAICGLILAIGHKCGERWVDGLKDATRRARDTEKYFAARRAMARMVDELPGILPEETQITNLLGLRRAFAESLPHVAKRLRSNEEARFSGLALWQEESHDIPALHATSGRYREQLAKLRTDASAGDVAALQRKFATLYNRALEGRRWFDRAWPFVAPGNLRDIIASFGVGATVDDKGVITIGKGDRPLVIGLGVYGLAEARNPPAPPARQRKR